MPEDHWGGTLGVRCSSHRSAGHLQLRSYNVGGRADTGEEQRHAGPLAPGPDKYSTASVRPSGCCGKGPAGGTGQVDACCFCLFCRRIKPRLARAPAELHPFCF